MSWIYEKSYDFYKCDTKTITDLYVIDLDGTLIFRVNCKNPSHYDPDTNNWAFIGAVPRILNNIKENGSDVIIVTNQNWGNNRKNEIRQKMEDVRQTLYEENGWCPFFFISYEKDEYRKPSIKFLELLPNPESIIVCGDAIGEGDEDPKYSWSSTDYDLYTNIYNQNNNTTFLKPNELIPGNKKSVINKILQKNYKLIIMVGNPGSGKTTFSKQLSNFIHLEKDKEKSEATFLKNLKNNLKENKCVIVDATNSSKEKRNKFISLVDKNDCCIVWLTCDGRPYNKLRQKPVPEVAYAVYTKQFEMPENDECTVYPLF